MCRQTNNKTSQTLANARQRIDSHTHMYLYIDTLTQIERRFVCEETERRYAHSSIQTYKHFAEQQSGAKTKKTISNKSNNSFTNTNIQFIERERARRRQKIAAEHCYRTTTAVRGPCMPQSPCAHCNGLFARSPVLDAIIAAAWRCLSVLCCFCIFVLSFGLQLLRQLASSRRQL